MSNVINTKTFQYLKSVGTTAYLNNPDWIINPTQEQINTLMESKAILDGIEKEANKRYVKKTRVEILSEIFNGCIPLKEIKHFDVVTQQADTPEQATAKLERQARLISILNDHPVILAFLDGNSYTIAVDYLKGLLQTGKMISEDFLYVEGIIPLEK